MEKTTEDRGKEAVFFRHNRNGAVTKMSRAVAEIYLRKGKGRIVKQPPEIDMNKVLGADND